MRPEYLSGSLSESPLMQGGGFADSELDGQSALPIRRRFHRAGGGVFLSLFGTSLAAFALGFDDCLFDLSTVDACVAHAESWIDRFKAVGMHLIEWAIALIKAAAS